MKLFKFFVFVFAFKICYSLKIYDECELKSGGQGHCQTYSSCKADWKKEKARICSYNSEEAIVCCPSAFITEPENERPSVKYCMAQSKIFQQTVSLISSAKSSTSAPLKPLKCGQGVGLIVGGTVTNRGEFPHMAILGWQDENGDYNFNCGASLISDWYILSAAHCADRNGLEPTIVRLGEQNVDKDTDNVHRVDYKIEKLIKYPDYKGIYNDIMLIKLSKQVNFSKFIRPACLWSQVSLNHTKAIAIGFGDTEFRGEKSADLLKVSLDIFDNDVCYESYKNERRVRQGISDTMICAGFPEGGKDTCQGDSGGPLQVMNGENHCRYYIIGVTSFGKTCGDAKFPAIYTRVYSFLNWIENIVWDSQ